MQSECEDARKTAPLPNDEETRPIISDQDLSSNGTVLSGDQTNGTDITAKQDTENDTETRTLKPSKSDSSLSVRSKSSLSEDAEINNLESPKTTSRSNQELSSAGRAVPAQLSVDNSGTQTQGVYKVTPTRGNLVPLTSYSSSDDEDEAEFFDADEYHESGSILSRSV